MDRKVLIISLSVVIVVVLLAITFTYYTGVGGPSTCGGPHNQLRRPVAPAIVTQKYSGPYPNHSGIDYAGSRGTKVRAVAPGRVILVRKLTTSYGKHVKIKHACGKVSLYAHLMSIRVHQGQKVGKGKVVGRRGSTGNSTGPHVHFEIYSNGHTINPDPWIKNRGRGYGGYDPSGAKDKGPCCEEPQ